jgi:uncharacterized protein
MSNILTITLKVQPRSSRESISQMENGQWKVTLTAPPVDGKANEALKKFLSKKMNIPKSNISIIKGETSKIKTITLTGISGEEFEARSNE